LKAPSEDKSTPKLELPVVNEIPLDKMMDEILRDEDIGLLSPN
jgi:hypothetical protein